MKWVSNSGEKLLSLKIQSISISSSITEVTGKKSFILSPNMKATLITISSFWSLGQAPRPSSQNDTSIFRGLSRVCEIQKLVTPVSWELVSYVLFTTGRKHNLISIQFYLSDFPHFITQIWLPNKTHNILPRVMHNTFLRLSAWHTYHIYYIYLLSLVNLAFSTNGPVVEHVHQSKIINHTYTHTLTLI